SGELRGHPLPEPGVRPGRNDHDDDHPDRDLAHLPAGLHPRHRHHGGGEVSPFRVALTFDTEHPDRPATDGNADRLLDMLDRLDVHGSFFIQGRWAEASPSTARRIVAAGHLVGSHSHYHVRMPLLSADGLATDVRDAEEAI